MFYISAILVAETEKTIDLRQVTDKLYHIIQLIILWEVNSKKCVPEVFDSRWPDLTEIALFEIQAMKVAILFLDGVNC
jgi:hypothetical protein